MHLSTLYRYLAVLTSALAIEPTPAARQTEMERRDIVSDVHSDLSKVASVVHSAGSAVASHEAAHGGYLHTKLGSIVESKASNFLPTPTPNPFQVSSSSTQAALPTHRRKHHHYFDPARRGNKLFGKFKHWANKVVNASATSPEDKKWANEALHDFGDAGNQTNYPTHHAHAHRYHQPNESRRGERIVQKLVKWANKVLHPLPKGSEAELKSWASDVIRDFGSTSTSSTPHGQTGAPMGQQDFATSSNPGQAPQGVSVQAVPLTDDVQKAQGFSSDVEYYGNIEIGGQTFGVVFDTGSVDLWVPGPDCDTCDTKERYNNSGKDLGKVEPLSFGKGEVVGTMYSDTVSIGKLSAENVSLLSVSEGKFEKVPSAGILGLGFKSLEKGPVFSTFLSQLMAQGKIAKPEFSFFLGRAASDTQAKSMLTFGGSDPSLYEGEFTTLDVRHPSYWQIPMDAVFINGTRVPDSSGSGIIDTGTTGIIVPPSIVESMAKAIKGGALIRATPNSPEQMLAFPCSEENTTFDLGFGGKRFAINPKDLIVDKIPLPVKKENSTEANSTSSHSAPAHPVSASPPFVKLNTTNSTSSPETRKEEKKEILRFLREFIEKAEEEAKAEEEKEEKDTVKVLYCITQIAGDSLPVDTGNDEPAIIVGDTFLKNWYTVFKPSDPPSVSFATAKLNQ